MLILLGPWPLIFLQSISAAGSHLQGTSRFMCLHSGRGPTTTLDLPTDCVCSTSVQTHRTPSAFFGQGGLTYWKKACLFRGKDAALMWTTSIYLFLSSFTWWKELLNNKVPVFLSVQTRVIVIFSSIITFLLFHVASCIQICWYTLFINVC